MLIKNNQSFRKIAVKLLNLMLFVFITTTEVWTQIRSVSQPPPAANGEDFTGWFVLLFVLALGLAGMIFWRLNNRKAKKNAASKSKEEMRDDKDLNSFDADKEFEWLRKNQKLVSKKGKPNPAKKRQPKNAPKAITAAVPPDTEQIVATPNGNAMPKLPIFSIHRLELATPFDALPISDDEDLITAVEQAYDEFEEDEEVRDLAVRILAAFKKRNSIEALAQIALYDLSANLRSKAVSILAEFDHETVFETILLANADPTREVRAAAARGLSKLSFDRADAWARIAETGEEGRMAQSARAAIESGFVDMSFDRLAHKDHKHAYEAFALMALLIKAGETEKIFNALEKHRDMEVRRAILHTIKVTKDRRAVDGLYALLEKNTLPIEFQEEVDKAIEEIGFVTA
jgi:hypothetical protein